MIIFVKINGRAFQFSKETGWRGLLFEMSRREREVFVTHISVQTSKK
jgi:hypothetical protein